MEPMKPMKLVELMEPMKLVELMEPMKPAFRRIVRVGQQQR